MRSINFRVENWLPPKKGGAISMWGKDATDTERARLIELRKAALADRGSQKPFEGDIRLSLRVHIGFSDKSTGATGSGDLDTFVAGVCDGLMKAHHNTLEKKSWHPSFDRPANAEVHPKHAIAYWDDSKIMEIRAKKTVASAPGKESWYEVTLEEL